MGTTARARALTGQARPGQVLDRVASGVGGASVALVLGPLLGGRAPSGLLVASAVVLAVVAALTAGVARRRTARGARAEAERLDAARRRTAHEITGPLAVALGHVDLVAEDPALDEEHRTSLEVGVRSVRRALRLVAELMGPVAPDDAQDATPSTRGRVSTDETVDLAALTREGVLDLAPLAARRQAAMSLDAPEPALVLGDASPLRQVVDNLLSNAVKYAADAGWVDVLVTAAGPDGVVVLQVTNAGTTLTPEEAERAFEAEFRAASTVGSATPGSGIGLAVVRDLVERHRGTVDLTSDPQSGTTTVTVRLPAAVAGEEAHGAPSPSLSPGNAPAGPGEGVTIEAPHTHDRRGAGSDDQR